MKKILLTGAHGMLGSDFIQSQGEKFQIIGLGKSELDITNVHQIEQKTIEHRPDIILNCAAYTNVELAEVSQKKYCFDINTYGVYALAKITQKYNVDFITLSTDYVFDGEKTGGYYPSDETNPINIYGLSKYLGEKFAQDINPNSIIIRTSWLYGGNMNTKNFVNTMIKLSQNKPELRVISDQFGTPTYTIDLSTAIASIIPKLEQYRGKVLHFSNETEVGNGVSWFDFAQKIFNIVGNSDIKLVPITTEEYPTKAHRPKNSKIINSSSIILQNWEESLKLYLSKLSGF